MKIRLSSKRPTTNPLSVTTVNPADVAAEIRSVPAPMADDRLRTDDGGWQSFDRPRESVRADRVGRGAGHLLLADEIRREIAAQRATAAALHGRLRMRAPELALLTDRLELRHQEQVFADSIPGSTITTKRKVIAIGGKVLPIVGDTAAVANVLYRSGAPMALSMLIGVSAAAAVVACGTKLGKSMQEYFQRQSRGPVPDGCPPGLRDLFADEDAPPVYRRWLAAGVVAAVALFVALSVTGVGAGDGAGIAIGAALLAIMTVPGAAALEAYATNAAADRRSEIAADIEQLTDRLAEFGDVAEEQARAACSADQLERSALHAAIAVSATTHAIADRSPDHPLIFGYADPMTSDLPEELPGLDHIERLGYPLADVLPQQVGRLRAASTPTPDPQLLHPSQLVFPSMEDELFAPIRLADAR